MTLQALLSLSFLFCYTFMYAQSDDRSSSILRGKQSYQLNCQACHMENGEGLPGVFPPLANADYLLEDQVRSVNVILKGQQGTIEVNGMTYNGIMSASPLSNREVADIMNYIGNTWGNKLKILSAEDIESIISKNQ